MIFGLNIAFVNAVHGIIFEKVGERFGIREIYLAVGLTRSYRGAFWPMIIGVHTLPDYEATVDYDNL